MTVFLPNTNTTPWEVPMQMREDTAYKKYINWPSKFTVKAPIHTSGTKTLLDLFGLLIVLTVLTVLLVEFVSFCLKVTLLLASLFSPKTTRVCIFLRVTTKIASFQELHGICTYQTLSYTSEILTIAVGKPASTLACGKKHIMLFYSKVIISLTTVYMSLSTTISKLIILKEISSILTNIKRVNPNTSKIKSAAA